MRMASLRGRKLMNFDLSPVNDNPVGHRHVSGTDVINKTSFHANLQSFRGTKNNIPTRGSKKGRGNRKCRWWKQRNDAVDCCGIASSFAIFMFPAWEGN